MAGFGPIVLATGLVGRAKGRRLRDPLIKYLAWFIIIPPILIPMVYSPLAFHVVVCLLSMQCFREYSRVCGLWEDRRLMILSYVLIAAIYVSLAGGILPLYDLMPLCATIVLLIVPLKRNEYEHMLQKVCLALLGVLCFGWFLSHLAYLRMTPTGLATVFFLIVLLECNDACGYLWGSLFGKHKLISRISPNKTVEGAVGGILSVLIIAHLMRKFAPFDNTGAILLVATLVAILGICGDLIVSFIKRDLGVKDMGSVIPGHGGVLDRVDSLILSAPIFFYVLRYCHG